MQDSKGLTGKNFTFNNFAIIGAGLTLALMLCLVTSAAHSESLMAIHGLAMGNDPQFKAAEASLAATKQALPQSTANFLPSLNASASHIENAESDIDATNSYALTLKQSIYKHSNFVQSRKADNAVAKAEAEFRSAEQALIVDAARAYFAVLSAQDNLEFAEAEKRSNARQLDQTQQRFDVGLVAITDVHESRAAYDISVAQAIESQNSLDGAGESLREITGSYHDGLDTLGDNMPLLPPSPEDLQDWTELALEQNPDLIAARQATRQAQENVNAQRSGNYPTVDLSLRHSGDDGTYIDTLGNTIDTEDNTTATLSVSMSLYSGGRTQSGITQARESLKQSRQFLEQTRRATQRTVRNAYRGVISGISRVKALKQALVSNQSALRAAEAGYEVGTRTTVDVLVGRRNLFSAQRDYAQSRYDYLLDGLRLQQAAGSLTANNLKTVSDWLR